MFTTLNYQIHQNDEFWIFNFPIIKSIQSIDSYN